MITGQTPCGLKYAAKKSGSAVAYCALSIRCGTRNEGGFHNGIAHFTEHTLFKGTAKKSSAVINSYLDKLGGELNAYTTKEEIVLHTTVLKEDLNKAAELLFEIATSATFPKEQIEIERGVVIDEINSYKDSPADDIFDKFEEKLFEGQSLGRSILGTAASVRKITSPELKDFVSANFRPSRMVFSVVADIDENKLAAKAEKLALKYFGEENADAGEIAGQEKQQAKLFRTVKDMHNHEANAVIGGPAPSLYQEDERLAVVLLSNILAGPASNSLLNKVLREKNGWVYGVECTYTQYSDTGVMAISLGCDKENMDNCLAEVDKVLDRLCTKPFSAAFLKAAKRQLLGQLAVSSDNGETQCLSMAKSMQAFGRVASDEENRKAIGSLSPELLQSVAQKVFAKEKLSKLIYL
ncbi:MAG: insulinase family protein [Bacteroidales bacterium]|nr:insulinase family protein [Bacteroidales bacterium]